MRVVDCWGHSAARDFVIWAQMLGFHVVTDIHSGQQLGVECGYLAALFSSIMLTNLDESKWMGAELPCLLDGRHRYGPNTTERKKLIAAGNMVLFNEVDNDQSRLLRGTEVAMLINEHCSGTIDSAFHPATLARDALYKRVAEAVHDAATNNTSTLPDANVPSVPASSNRILP